VSAYVVWWIVAAVLVGVELATGTFYLLAVGAAFAIGGLAAYAGLEVWAQFAIASVISLIGISAANRWRQRLSQPPQMRSFDVGQTVRVLEWRDNGTARVQYRGSQWDAELASPEIPRGETMMIQDMRGSVLVLTEAQR
jgi:membrane protein implicated in regulation of membrane protease activity